MAATVAAGIDGIEKKITPPQPMTGIAYADLDSENKDRVHLPKSLSEALQALQDDQVIVTALGQEFVKCFVAIKRHEIEEAEKTKENLIEFERNLYFEFL